ncbi:hypothetical protein QYM36_004104 [Artemia franciscana]|uniref:Proteasomal ubiquitin receptor ADRM1 n=1 Tax=Artemia franciscana TaxID=6661 RepID=A0AA88IE19_ARTSF|nr:hypothetical protein QYM36_004104 [Artemia franciscana]
MVIGEQDLIIFPDDCEFKKVPQCTTGRVFLLKFKSSGKKIFFWMQEPKADKDDEYLKKVNESLNNPPTPGSQGQRTPGTPGDRDLQSLLSNMSQQQLMQFFGGVGGLPGISSLLSTPEGGARSRREQRATSVTPAGTPVTTPAAPSTTTTTTSATPQQSTGSGVQLSTLQSILSGIAVPTEEKTPPVNLSEGLSLEALQPILSNSEFVQKLKEYLPSGTPTGSIDDAEAIRSTIHSPQFQQAFALFSSAIQSGQLGPLVQQFGMSETAVAAADAGNLEAFVKALQEQKKKNKDGDDDMNVD